MLRRGPAVVNAYSAGRHQDLLLVTSADYALPDRPFQPRLPSPVDTGYPLVHHIFHDSPHHPSVGEAGVVVRGDRALGLDEDQEPSPPAGKTPPSHKSWSALAWPCRSGGSGLSYEGGFHARAPASRCSGSAAFAGDSARFPRRAPAAEQRRLLPARPAED